VQKIFLLSILALVTIAFSACASRRSKSEAHIYEGDAPNIRYAPSSAGGPQSYY
jgi:hypothetical protein